METAKQLKDRERYQRNRELFIERNRAWRKANPVKAKQLSKRNWEKLKDNPKKYDQYLNGRSTAQRRLKIKVLEHYAKGTPYCECCGVVNVEFLSLDHIKGKGNIHRKAVGGNLYKWAAQNKFPTDIFRILCMNCNVSYGYYGYCPHTSQSLVT